MGNVYSITLCDRDLHHVPDDIYKHHKHVAKLLLRRNNIQEIPPEIKVLTNLVELSLRDNLIASVPHEVKFSFFSDWIHTRTRQWNTAHGPHVGQVVNGTIMGGFRPKLCLWHLVALDLDEA